MAMSSPAKAPAALGNITAVTVTGIIRTQNANQRGVVRVSADGAFRLNIVAWDDTGANSYVVKSVSSSTITVDGATAGYVNNAVIEDFPWPANGEVQIYASGGALNWIADWRLYE